jgi:hypothetical protein
MIVLWGFRFGGVTLRKKFVGLKVYFFLYMGCCLCWADTAGGFLNTVSPAVYFFAAVFVSAAAWLRPGCLIRAFLNESI